jgi:hypothetical protein
MESTLITLKEEINKTNEAEHDLAKWKLGVTAMLGAAAFGLGRDPENPQYWLLLFVPFVCAYVDLFSYQYELRIRVIARFLRVYGDGDPLLRDYERECEQERKKGVFSLSNVAEFGCSLAASVIGPLFYLLQNVPHQRSDSWLVSPAAAAGVWIGGVALIVALWVYFHVRARSLSDEQ